MSQNAIFEWHEISFEKFPTFIGNVLCHFYDDRDFYFENSAVIRQSMGKFAIKTFEEYTTPHHT